MQQLNASRSASTPSAKLPRRFRQARLMTTAGRARRAPRTPLIVLLSAISAVATGLAVHYSGLEDLSHRSILNLLRAPHPSSNVVVVQASTSDLSQQPCGEVLEKTLSQHRVRSAFLLPPAQSLCPNGTSRLPSLDPAGLHITPDRRVWGTSQGPEGQALASTLGVTPARWTLRSSDDVVPSVSLASLTSGAAPGQLLANRIALVAWDTKGAAPLGTVDSKQVASAIGALVDGQQRHEVPLPYLLGLMAVCGLAIGWLGTATQRTFAATLLLLGSLSVAAISIAVALWTPWLVPIVSVVAASWAAWLPPIVHKSKLRHGALREASEHIRRVGSISDWNPRGMTSASFFGRLIHLATQAHPAEQVMIAELPPGQWHLKFWTQFPEQEYQIADRRKDARRYPFADPSGINAPRLVTDFVARQDNPVVLVPLLASGELEGFLFLCGPSAQEKFLQAPEVANQLGQEAAQRIRQRRLDADQIRAHRVFPRGTPESELVFGTTVAVDGLDVLGAMIREAPIGLLFVDAYGYVRLMGRPFAELLRSRGLVLPNSTDGVAVAAGQLSLRQVFEQLNNCAPDKSADLISRLLASDAPLQVELPGVGILSARSIRRDHGAESSVTGFVVTLSASTAAAPSTATTDVPADGLSALSIQDLIASTTATATEMTQRMIHTDPVAAQQHAFVCPSFGTALRDFLVHALAHTPHHQTPAVSVSEGLNAVVLTLRNLDLGVGLDALHVAISTTDVPSRGLESFSALVRSVSRSLGHVSVSGHSNSICVNLHLLSAQQRAGNPLEAANLFAEEDLAKTMHRNEVDLHLLRSSLARPEGRVEEKTKLLGSPVLPMTATGEREIFRLPTQVTVPKIDPTAPDPDLSRRVCA